jgi:hypothetical protein
MAQQTLTLNLKLTFGVHVLKERTMYRPLTKVVDNVETIEICSFWQAWGSPRCSNSTLTSQKDEFSSNGDGILNK